MITKEQLLIHPKKIVDEELVFKIPVGLTNNSVFNKNLCAWEELINTQGPLPTDIVICINWMEDESDLEGNYIVAVVVSRKREETDKEYEYRLKCDEEQKQRAEESDQYEYERLKLKYGDK
jgi:hypothetical protein